MKRRPRPVRRWRRHSTEWGVAGRTEITEVIVKPGTNYEVIQVIPNIGCPWVKGRWRGKPWLR